MIRDEAPPAERKEGELSGWLARSGSIAIGFSGGVDSTYLAALSVSVLGPDHVVGILGRSASVPGEQAEQARTLAGLISLPLVEVDTEEMLDSRYVANPTNRCYFCKGELWSKVVPIARERAAAVIADGTNADDLRGHRPGVRAAAEQGVVSPLAMFEFSKEDVRERSRAHGLPTWDQPASPCLASRIPYHTPVTVGRLRRIERAEAALRALGIAGDLRVRHHGDLARVELSPAELARWTPESMRATVETAVRSAGYERVELDARGFRSGALNESR